MIYGMWLVSNVCMVTLLFNFLHRYLQSNLMKNIARQLVQQVAGVPNMRPAFICKRLLGPIVLVMTQGSER